MAETITGIAVFVIFLSANSALLHAAPAQPSHPSPSPPDCVRDLVAFSPCLSYVSAPPNNITVIPALECCGVVSSALNSNGSCLCYLLRQPLIFSFPLNLTRVASLPRLCNWRDSLDSLCSSAPPELPPLQNMTNTAIPSDSANEHHQHPPEPDEDVPSISSPAQPAKNSSAPFNFPPENSGRSPSTTSTSSYAQVFRTKQVLNRSWLLPAILIFPIVFILNTPLALILTLLL